MKRFDVKCPYCGEINHDVYLDETNGWLECEGCSRDVNVKGCESVLQMVNYMETSGVLVFAE